MFILTAFLTGLISYYISSIFNKGVYLFLLFFSFVVLNIEVLSLFKGIDDVNILILTLIEFLICHFIWIKKGRPLLKVDISNFFKELKELVKKDKTFLLLISGLIFMLTVSFILALISPPNEADATSYHALRSLFWVKDGFIHHFETADVRCHSMPINSELFYVWTLSLGKNDCIFGLLEYFSYFLLIFSSYKIMELINIDFNKRIWAILIFSSFAGVISQISSTQTDLIIGSLFCLSMYLFLEFKKGNKDISLLYFSSLSLALSFGVKSTGVMGSIPIVIWYLIELRKDIKSFIKFFLFLIINFLILSSYNYWLNLINYGNAFGAATILNEHRLNGNLSEGAVSNLIKYFLYLFDFSGLSLVYLFSPLYDNFVQALFNFLHIDPYLYSNGEIPRLNATLSEQVTGLGVLGFLLLLPCYIKSLFDKNLRKFPVIFIFQAVILSCTIIYFPSSIRFFIAYVSILIPVLTLSYKNRFYKLPIIIIALFYMIYTPLFLVQRPFLKIKKEFKNSQNIKTLTDNIRDVRYDFYLISKKQTVLKDELKNLSDNKKTGLFLNESFMAYTIKHLEFENGIKIDFLTLSNNNDLSKYDYLVIENYMQGITTIKDFSETYEKNRLCKTASINNRPNGKMCYVNDDFFLLNGFKPVKTISYKADKFLKNMGHDKDSELYIFKNTMPR